MQTERMKRFPLPLEPLRVLPLVFVSLFLVVAAVDALLILQPTALQPLRDGWQHWVSADRVPASFASLFATGVAIAGIAIAAAILSTFIRGAQTNPYVWLAPILVGACALMVGRMQIEIPLPLSTQVFAAIAALLLLGGGALFQVSSPAVKSAGALLLSLPLVLLAAGYSQTHGGSSASAHNGQILIFVLSLASLGTLVLSIANRRVLQASRDGLNEDGAPQSEHLREQLVTLLERAKAGEARALQAEHQLAQAGMYPAQSALHLGSDADELQLLRPRGPGRLFVWVSLLFAAGCAAAVYVGAYLPLQTRMTAQKRLIEKKDAQQAVAIKALQTRFDEERRTLEEQVAAARKMRAQEAEPSVTANPATAPIAAAPAAQAIEKAPQQVTDKAQRSQAAQARPAPAETTHSAPAARVHKPIAAHKKAHGGGSAAKTSAPKGSSASRPNSASKAHGDDGEAMNDDPIGGLEDH